MYNFSVSKTKDPYDFSIPGSTAIPTKATKALNLSGSLTKNAAAPAKTN